MKPTNPIIKSILFISCIYANLLTPENGDSLHFTHVLLEWEQEADATYYNLQVSESINFNNPIVQVFDSTLLYIDTQHIEWEKVYYWRVLPMYPDGSNGDWIDTLSFSIGSPKFNVQTEQINSDEIMEGITIFSDFSLYRSGAVDQLGNEIWNDGFLNLMMSHINPQGQIFGGLGNAWLGAEININGDTIWNGPQIDIHDLKQLPNGNYMSSNLESELGPIPFGSWTPIFQELGYTADGVTIEYLWLANRLLELDQITGEELWSWSPFDHFTMDDYDNYGGTWCPSCGSYDWTHYNSFDFDADESAIYVSHRNLSRITKIDYPSGEVIWMMGLPEPYMASGADHICSDLGFSFQHDIQLLDNGNLLLFDNGNLSSVLFGAEYSTSRVLEIEVVDNNSCQVIWDYDLPIELFSPWMGAVQKLNNGNYLITSKSGGGTILEITPDKEEVWRASTNLYWPNGNLYRAYRIPSLHPFAYSVIFNNYSALTPGFISPPGITISEGNKAINIEISNENGYVQLFQYTFMDNQGWFLERSDTITLEPEERKLLTFEAFNVSGTQTHIHFEFAPIHHTYGLKNFTIPIYFMHEGLQGDVNSDGVLNVQDIVVLVNIIIGNFEQAPSGDVNNDGEINVLDIVDLVAYIFAYY